mgnify:CR=1 FL=1
MTAASPAVRSSAALATLTKDNVPLPFVPSACPLEPSELGRVNAVQNYLIRYHLHILVHYSLQQYMLMY